MRNQTEMRWNSWALGLRFTWIPTVRKIMAFMANIMGLGLVFYMLLGFG